MPRLIALALLLAVAGVHAEGATPDRRAELGVRYWLSTGATQWSHNAQGFAPVNGNPTSILTYESMIGQSVELHGRLKVGAGWFLRGYAGIGGLERGSFDDEDFERGQVKFSDTRSSVKGDRLLYSSADIARELWSSRTMRLDVFAGYHGLIERIDAYGLRFVVNPSGLPNLPDSVLVLSNEATWDSLHLGMSLRSAPAPKARLLLDVAWVPYAKLYNEDSHWLRSDLGPAPNVFIDGRGSGLRLELDLRYRIHDDWEVGAGFRHWWMRADRGDVRIAGVVVPLAEFETKRSGLMLTLTRRW